jgi:hypothetical protein
MVGCVADAVGAPVDRVVVDVAMVDVAVVGVTAPGAEDCAHPEDAVAIRASAAVASTNLTRRCMANLQ